MPEHPYMPVNTGRLLADTGHLSAEEMGAYSRLLCTMWQQGGMLRDDEIELARIAGIGIKRWRRCVAPRVMRFFTVIGGLVSQKRLSATWLDVKERRRKLSQASTVAAAKRLKNLDRSAANGPSNGHLTKTKKEDSFFLSEAAREGREMTAEEFMTMRQRRASLPIQVKQRGNQ